MLLLGIDVGGTFVKFGLIEDGRIIRTMQLATNTFDVIKQLVNGARELVQSEGRSFEEVQGVGVGFPGMVVDSVVMDSPNIGMQNCNLQEILSEEFGKPTVVKNDAEMATIAEHRLGSGKNAQNMVFITLGTGVGGGIIVDGKLYAGNGGAGELGHIILEHNGRECPCGRKGCAEQYISMKALDKLAKDTLLGYPNTCIMPNGEGSIYASELIRAYKRNDACAIEVVSKYVEQTSTYLLDLCNLFRPEKIVIGGGVSHAPELLNMIAKACKDQNYGYNNSPKVDIVPATLGNEAGMLGAIVCFEENMPVIESRPNENLVEDYFNIVNEEPVELSSVNEVDVVDDNITEEATEVVEEVDLLSAIVNASKTSDETDNSLNDTMVEEQEEEIEYDEGLIDRVNEMLKRKD